MRGPKDTLLLRAGQNRWIGESALAVTGSSADLPTGSEPHALPFGDGRARPLSLGIVLRDQSARAVHNLRPRIKSDRRVSRGSARVA